QPPAAAAVSQPMAAGASGSMPAAPGEGNPDLSSLLSTAKGWEAGPGPGPAPSPASTLNGIGPSNGKPKLATGSNQVASPGGELPPGHSGGVPAMAPAYESGAISPIQAPPMSGPMAVPASMPPHPSRELFDSMASYSRGMPARRDSSRKGIVLMVVGGAAIAAVAVAVALVVTRSPGGSADRPAGTAGSQAQTPAVADQNTGFDLYVTPAGITQWKLDGETRTDRLPSRIRGIAPGVHRVQIDAPPGFLSQAQRVEVVAGRADRVDIKLEPIQGIHGLFESNPPGAAVSLIIDGKRQELGPAPAKAPLDPRHTYQVLFEKPGFVSVNKPIVFTGALEEKLAVTLDKASVAAEDPPKAEPPRPTRPTPPRPDPPKVGVGPKIDPPRPDPPKVNPPKPDPPKATGTGTLAINSKPSCEIYVDGASTGLYTPQLALKLPAGKRRITLVNNEYGIKESFAVEISADKPAKMIKDYSDRLPK
ncbi:MAG TPA: carboxypeptidase regulatory-like domain-containing protein, partial [Kofleriaceae bacterium]|nr:carboxypeptidase regulatory-like domain-containing protein [Kofleriaceae bacterium]